MKPGRWLRTATARTRLHEINRSLGTVSALGRCQRCVRLCPPSGSLPWRRGRGCGGTRCTCQAHLEAGVQGRACRAQREWEVPKWAALSTHPPHHLVGHPAIREAHSWGLPCGWGELRGTPVLTLGLLENSHPRGQSQGCAVRPCTSPACPEGSK